MTENQRLSNEYIEAVKSRAQVLSVVQARGIELKRAGAELIGLCPFHDDKKASFRVDPKKNVWNCSPCDAVNNLQGVRRTAIGFVMKYDGVEYVTAVRTVGREMGLSDDGPRAEPKADVRDDEPMHVVATYEYRDAAGKLLAKKDRLEHVPRKPGVKDMRWRGGRAKPWTPTLYKLPEVVSAISDREPILIVEGEKKVDMLMKLGFVATCNEDGAGKWSPEHSEHLRGARVIVIPDIDAAGTKHADAVEKALADVAESVWQVRLDKSPDDWLDDGGTVGQLGELVADALFEGACARAKRDLQALGAGDEKVTRKRRPLLRPALSLWDRERKPVVDLVDQLIPTSGLVVQASHPKTGKTWIEEEIAVSIATGTPAFGRFATGEPKAVALFLFEEGDDHTQTRLGAISAGKGLRLEDALRRVFLVCKPHLNLLDIDDQAHVVASVRELPERPAAVFLDPLRDAHDGHEVDDMDEVTRALRRLSVVLECTIFVTHHNRKPSNGLQPKGQAGDEMRGGGELRGRIDAGIYPRLKGGDQVNTFELEVTTDKRDGQKAAPFALRLDIEDVDKRAVNVRWTVDGFAEAKTKRSEGSVLMALVELNHEAPSGFHPVSAIAKAAKIRNADCQAALEELKAKRKAERSLGKGGWRLLTGEIPGVPSVPGLGNVPESGAFRVPPPRGGNAPAGNDEEEIDQSEGGWL